MASGDHFQVQRQHGLFQHHGIDIGDGTIVHYLEGKKIIRSSTKDFRQNKKIKIIYHENESPKEITLERAISRIGEKNYNLLFNNCEHFANWCKTGKHRSLQIEKFLEKSAYSVMAIGQIFPAAFLTGLNLFLQQGVLDYQSPEKAKQQLIKIKNFQSKLGQELDLILEKINITINNDKTNQGFFTKSPYSRKLFLFGQILADKLTVLENLETQITDLLNQPEG